MLLLSGRPLPRSIQSDLGALLASGVSGRAWEPDRIAAALRRSVSQRAEPRRVASTGEGVLGARAFASVYRLSFRTIHAAPICIHW
jgi:hypothetical protein